MTAISRVPLAGYPAHGIGVTFAFTGIDEITDDGDLYPYCTSGSVRFHELASGEPRQLLLVPPVVFSEAMRDVDLAVSVSARTAAVR